MTWRQRMLAYWRHLFGPRPPLPPAQRDPIPELHALRNRQAVLKGELWRLRAEAEADRRFRDTAEDPHVC